MIRAKQLLGFLFTLAGCGGVATAGDLQLRWSELAGAVSGKTVTVVTREDTRVEGRVRSVDPEGLVIDVTQSSRMLEYQPGTESLVPRTAISRIELRNRVRGALRGAVIGIGVGAAGTGVAAVLCGVQASQHVSSHTSSQKLRQGAFVIGGVAVAIGTVLGIQTGREYSRKSRIVITILPDQASASSSRE